MIWTTTPWTIPANRAVAYNPTIDYATVRGRGAGDRPRVRTVGRAGRPADHRRGPRGGRVHGGPDRALAQGRPGRSWRRCACRHPLAALDPGYNFDVPMLAGAHVTDDAGTGFVHTAPGHGADDYAVWLANGHNDIPETVDEDGAYFPGCSVVRRPERSWRPRARRPVSSGPANTEVTRQADRGWNPAGARPGGTQLSALLAVQGAGDLPQHAAVVHPARRAARTTPSTTAPPCGRPRSRRSTTPPSTRRTAATASAPWSKTGRTG